MPQFNIADSHACVSVKSSVNVRQPGSAKGKILFIAPDFDEPLADFAEYRISADAQLSDYGVKRIW